MAQDKWFYNEHSKIQILKIEKGIVAYAPELGASVLFNAHTA